MTAYPFATLFKRPLIFSLAASLCLLAPMSNVSAGEKNYKMKVTNSTAREIKITWACKNNGSYNKLGSKKFPGSKGKTRGFTTSCTYPYIKFEAKIVDKWKKAKVHYLDDGSLPSKNAVAANNRKTTKKWVPTILTGGIASHNYKMCFYIYEEGRVQVLPRQC